MSAHRGRVVAHMFIATVCFALMGAAVRWAVQYVGIGEVLLYRALLGVVVLTAVGRLRGVPLMSPHPRQQWLQACATAVGLGAYFVAIAGLPLATALTLNYTSTLWVALLAAAAVYARTCQVRRVDALVALAGFAGVVLVLQPSWTAQSAPYGLAGLASGLIAALTYRALPRLAALGEPLLRTLLHSNLAVALLGLGLASIFGWHPLTGPAALAVSCVAALALAGQWFLSKAFASGEMVLAASLQYLGVVHAALLAGALFGDWPGPVAWLGTGLIVLAALVCLRSRR